MCFFSRLEHVTHYIEENKTLSKQTSVRMHAQTHIFTHIHTTHAYTHTVTHIHTHTVNRILELVRFQVFGNSASERSGRRNLADLSFNDNSLPEF